MTLQSKIAAAICAQEGFAPDDMHAFAEGEPNYLNYMPHAARVLAEVSLHDALDSIGIASTNDGHCDPNRRRLWRDAEYLGQFDAHEAWGLFHSLEATP